jgi:hypothetical protein
MPLLMLPLLNWLPAAQQAVHHPDSSIGARSSTSDPRRIAAKRRSPWPQGISAQPQFVDRIVCQR